MGVEKRGLSKINLILIVSVIVILIGVGVLFYNLVFTGDIQDNENLVGGEIQQPNPVSQQCAFACETNQKSGWCDVERTLPDEGKETCENLASQNQYDVQSCTEINCNEVLDQSCSGIGGEWTVSENGECPSRDGFFVRERSPTDNPPTAGELCCYYYQ